MNEMKLTVPQEDAGKRIDSWLSEHIDGLTRSAVQNLLSEQAVNADGKAVKKNYKLAGGEVLTVIMPELREVDLAAERKESKFHAVLLFISLSKNCVFPTDFSSFLLLFIVAQTRERVKSAAHLRTAEADCYIFVNRRICNPSAMHFSGITFRIPSGLSRKTGRKRLLLRFLRTFMTFRKRTFDKAISACYTVTVM
jgi:ribosomal 50S subunit-recycling heat shock protein